MPTQALASRLLTGTTSRTYAAASYDDTKRPTGRERHMLSRFTGGYTPADLTRMHKAGGYYAWFEDQLKPSRLAESTYAKALPGWFPELDWAPALKDARQRSGLREAWEHARDLGNLSMLRRIYSRRQVLEQMTDFWSNHLHVPAIGDNAWVMRKSYDALLRRYALTTFESLLIHATLHPSMQLYLDNYLSVRGAPNENHGRELLELHTVGKSAGYTEQMVKDSAKILSGYTVDLTTWVSSYDPARHTTGSVTVLGFSRANSSSDGRPVTVAYLKYLAHHPATAHRIARKLAVRFVSDNPSSALVNELARTYLRSGTDIKSVLRTLVHSSEFWSARGKKVRPPVDDLIATCRALRVTAARPTADQSFARAINYVHGSVPVYLWPRPDGAPDSGDAWSSVSRILSSIHMHWALAGGWWPSRDVTYRRPTYWMPKSRIRLDMLVDHLSRTWLGRPSTDRLLQAVCVAIDETPGAVVTSKHAVMRWKFPRLAVVLLDSPVHMSR